MGNSQSGGVSGGFLVSSAIEPERKELMNPTTIGNGMIKNESFLELRKKSYPFVF